MSENWANTIVTFFHRKSTFAEMSAKAKETPEPAKKPTTTSKFDDEEEEEEDFPAAKTTPTTTTKAP